MTSPQLGVESTDSRVKFVEYKGNRIPFYYDPISGEWLSTFEHVHQFGRRTSPNGVFLRHAGGVIGVSSGKQFFNPGDFVIEGVIVWISGMATNTPSCDLEIYSGLSVLHTQSWTTSSFLAEPFLLTNQKAAFSVKVKTGSTTAPTQPIVTIGTKWRLA